MIPQITVAIGQDIRTQQPVDHPTRTYAVDWKRGRITGFVDGRQAMHQAIIKTPQTERFANLIYSWNYGLESRKILGRPDLVEREIKLRIREALMADSRISGVGDITISKLDRRSMLAKFTVETVFGDVGVSINV